MPVHVVDAVRVLDFPPASFTTQQLGVSGIAQRIAARHPLRHELTVTNTAAETVYLAADASQATASVGYPLPAGATIRLGVRADVWAATAGRPACARAARAVPGRLTRGADRARRAVGGWPPPARPARRRPRARRSTR